MFHVRDDKNIIQVLHYPRAIPKISDRYRKNRPNPQVKHTNTGGRTSFLHSKLHIDKTTSVCSQMIFTNEKLLFL